MFAGRNHIGNNDLGDEARHNRSAPVLLMASTTLSAAVVTSRSGVRTPPRSLLPTTGGPPGERGPAGPGHPAVPGPDHRPWLAGDLRFHRQGRGAAAGPPRSPGLPA